ncbi:MAG: hypothetical protein MJZ30_14790 [Paludibacteraceae bacterium]|nr:hypothetical protein [Paludibacteraceae bacterium]
MERRCESPMRRGRPFLLGIPLRPFGSALGSKRWLSGVELAERSRSQHSFADGHMGT